jgi:hypothetical protein
VYVEIWVEKDALAGVIRDITDPYDVPLMPTRGYPSLSFLSSAAETIQAIGKPTYLYYFGDHDPTGVNIPVTIERDLREFAPDADITFTKVGVTAQQIKDWNLPTRETKKTDPRIGNFEGDSAELDAIHPDTLRAMVRECIERHIDRDALQRLRMVEEQERQTLRNIRLQILYERGATGDTEVQR